MRTQTIKHWGVLAILLIGLAALLNGCAERGFENYEKALALTDQINSGVEKTDLTLKVTFDKTGLSESELKQLESFEELSATMTHTFNHQSDTFAIDGYLSFGGLGFDGALYKMDQGHFAYLPMINRYVHFEELVASGLFAEYAQGKEMPPPMTDAMVQSLQDVWKALLSEENVFTGSPTLLETDEGELKATVYEIKLTPEQMHQGLTAVLAIFREDATWVKYIDDQLLASEANMTMDDLLDDTTWSDLQTDNATFSYTAYADRDGYIIKEHITYSVTPDQADSILRSVEFSMDTQLEQRNQVETIDMPAFSEENTLRPEALKTWIEGNKK